MGAQYGDANTIFCSSCYGTDEAQKIERQRKRANNQQQRKEAERQRKRNEQLSNILLTTEAAPTDLQIERRLGIITAESALGMNVFRDALASLSDLAGGRSQSTQKVLRKARESALAGLREEAFGLGADAVIAVDLDYSEFSGGGKSMLFLVASGTAVEVREGSSDHEEGGSAGGYA
jgi:uncharacterized protein YbjQ (UPF0145 family)